MKRVVLSTLVFAAVLAAQIAPVPNQWQEARRGQNSDAVKQALQLSDEQITQLRDVRKAEFEAIRPVTQQLRENQQLLRDKIGAGAAAAEVGQIMLDMEALKAQVRQIHENSRNQLLGVLDATQQGLLEKLKEAATLQPAIGQATGLGLLERGQGRSAMGGMRRGGSQATQMFGPQMMRNGKRGPGANSWAPSQPQ